MFMGKNFVAKLLASIILHFTYIFESDEVAHLRRCGVPASNPVSSTMIPLRAILKYCEHLLLRGRPSCGKQTYHQDILIDGFRRLVVRLSALQILTDFPSCGGAWAAKDKSELVRYIISPSII